MAYFQCTRVLKLLIAFEEMNYMKRNEYPRKSNLRYSNYSLIERQNMEQSTATFARLTSLLTDLVLNQYT